MGGKQACSVVTVVERVVADDRLCHRCRLFEHRPVSRVSKDSHPWSLDSQRKKAFVTEAWQPTVACDSGVVKIYDSPSKVR
jgi:hypothetical protein